MNHTHYDLGYQQAGNVVRIHLSGDAPNVRLLDDSNYRIYCSGTGDFREYGGIAARTLVPLPVPQNGHWHVAVDFAGLDGSCRSSVDVLAQAA